MIYIMDTSFRDINNKKDVTNNRRLNKSVYSYLIESKALENYIKIAERESLVKIIALIDDTKDLDPALRIEFRHKILERFPDFKFFDKEEKISTAARAILVTNKSYDEKQKALQYILDVEIPLNSKEIGKAIALGDLRENAEYKAGKEKQEMLNASVAKLKDEIDKSQIMREDEVNTNKVSFGTRVVLENLLSSTVEEYSIFGPWESDPSRNIISYMSPFGTELWLHAVGEELGFTINDKEYKYRVKEIKKADF
jgi:transcription elongation factor GreA